MTIVLVVAMFVSLAGVFNEADCDDDCQSEKGTCCACICCPSIVVMTLADSHSVQFEYATCLWTLTRTGFLSEQEWFTNIDHPPQNLS